METIKFKTNIKCSGCIATVTPHLNEAVGEGKWGVDLSDPAKVLTIADEKDAAKAKEAVEKAGYRAEKI
ncbi:MAG: heavy metal transport/detoxification protein [Cyclobacteriaceae bacterium]|nr:heavy metal transport/detoxification protein [Cyclobacteriaceae bacterium]MBX2956593.1 heavy metal transport/detoxification protein [Cyclobacteriaceae bacterium]